jgi:Protein of unknown function (DUF2911)
MRNFALLGALLLVACGPRGPVEHYGFVARLGNDTVSVERVTRSGNDIVSDEVDRFPIVHQRHTEMQLGPDGAIQHLVMDIHTPSDPADQRDRHVVADVTKDSVLITKRDKAGGKRWSFALPHGAIAMPHLPQMYSLYELYFAAALKRADSLHLGMGSLADSVQVRQYYIDREFDRFPLHRGIVWRESADKADIAHDWLAGVGEATIDSTGRMVSYSGSRTTYKVDVTRVADVPRADVDSVGARFAALEAKTGVKALSVRDQVRATIGSTMFIVEYSRPVARGRVLLGNVIPYDRVWRTGANAATELDTSAPITLAGLSLPAGKYTLWTLPSANGAQLIVNRQTGQWGTSYDASQDLGRAKLTTETLATPVDTFTISITPKDARNGALALEWGPFRWTAPIVVR